MAEAANEEQIDNKMSTHDVEKMEEAKLKAKYPGGIVGGPGRSISGHSAFLQKRLAKGQKFFDSGDYQMAKQKISGGVSKYPPKVSQNVNPYATGDAIPTPETVPARKTSIIQPSKFPSSQQS